VFGLYTHALNSIGASILSHHCDDFSLVSAFFLFSIGCVNMLCGLIWRENAKDRRSVTSWREDKRTLPQHSTGHSSFRASLFGGPSAKLNAQQTGEKGYGFGRQGEKAAGLKGGSNTRLISVYAKLTLLKDLYLRALLNLFPVTHLDRQARLKNHVQ
jgi:hypothetical protein